MASVRSESSIPSHNHGACAKASIGVLMSLISDSHESQRSLCCMHKNKRLFSSLLVLANHSQYHKPYPSCPTPNNTGASSLLELLLGAQLVGVATLALAAVGGTGREAGLGVACQYWPNSL